VALVYGFHSLIETAKATKVNPFDYVWYILTKAILCKTGEAWNQQFPWDKDNDEKKKLHDARTSATPDPNKTSPI